MGRFAYSLQEVLSYFILSPRCLHDGSKVAYGGREWLVTPPDGAKLASRWLQLAPSWPKLALNWPQDPSIWGFLLPYGPHIRSKKS